LAQRLFPLRRARQVVPGGATSQGSGGVLVACSADGWVRLNLASGDFIDIYAKAGTQFIPDIHVNGVGSASAFTPLATNVVVNVCDY